MSSFRQFIAAIEQGGELLRITRSVAARYELGALLKQAEARRKAVLFESVMQSPFQVVGGLLTSTARFGLALNNPDAEQLTQAEHVIQVRNAIQSPLPFESVATGPCKHTVLQGTDIDCGQLPVPTFFAGDSGPFLTAAVGISRNPANGVINAGFYRVLVLGPDSLAISVSPSSDLLHFIRQDAEQGVSTHVALVVGAEPALLMAAAAKVPAAISELDVAGALQGTPLVTVQAECSDLPVPASAEFVIEVEIDHSATIDNTMGEFGDTYGSQIAQVGKVQAITHREEPVFHVIMAGAGLEHNTVGMIILYEVETDLALQLRTNYPDVQDVRIVFDPPSLGTQGDAYIRMPGGRNYNATTLIEHIFSLNCGQFPLTRIIRRVILVDDDIAIDSRRELSWAMAVRATESTDYLFFDNLDNSGGMLRLGIDARAHADSQTERLIIPDAGRMHLDDN